jgi:DNA (cytosine-5)-methyltransferase 1
MKSLELFSGAGGFAKGLELAGFDHAGFVEFNKHAAASLNANFDENKVYFGDIREYDFDQLSNIDVVAGGPPCQPFSLGGLHKAFDDDRDMFPYAIKAIEKLYPKAFIFENVKGLLRQSFSSYFDYIIMRLTFPDFPIKDDMKWSDCLKLLKSIDYNQYRGNKYYVQYKILNAANFGVPQSRERVIIVGIRADTGLTWHYPEPTHTEERLLWDQYVTNNYCDRHNINRSLLSMGNYLPNDNKIARLKRVYGLFPPESKPWQTVRDVIGDVPHPETNHGIPDHVFRDGARSYPGHTGSPFDWLAKTIKAGGHGVPGGENMIRYHDGSIRYFTTYEAKLIQTFPKRFIIKGEWGETLRQIGNAVPVVLAERLGQSLKALLDSPSQKSCPTIASIPHAPVKHPQRRVDSNRVPESVTATLL